ncbi:MAG: hypothetical protein M3O30_01625 [Planctomycetota bacterium]|nr:hypothetical protein [Planctomycetota bacterium]
MKLVTSQKRFFPVVAGISLLGFSAAFANAGIIYSNGFENGDPGTHDFFDSTTNTQGADITIAPNGGGVLHLTAPQGTHYAEITNVHDTYQAGYGQSVFTDFGAGAAPGIVINGPFFQSTSYYINTGWAAASANNNFQGFWIDTTPSNDPTFKDETNFRIVDTGSGSIGVQMVGLGGSGSTSITASGWYTFRTTFENDGSGNVMNNMSVLDSLGNTVGSYTADSTMPYANLAGTSYGDWTTVWQNGFANDVLAIDNVQVGNLPEPASLSLIGLSSTLLLRRRRRAV